MKKLYLLLLTLLVSVAANAATTYAVQGSLCGDNWNAPHPMTEASTGVWEYAFTADAGGNNMFKIRYYENGELNDTWLGAGRFSHQTGISGTDNIEAAVKPNGQYIIRYTPNDGNKLYLIVVDESKCTSSKRYYGIHGQMFASNWATKAMTESPDGVWSITFTSELTNAEANFGVREASDTECSKQVRWLGWGDFKTRSSNISQVGSNMKVSVESGKNYKFTVDLRDANLHYS